MGNRVALMRINRQVLEERLAAFRGPRLGGASIDAPVFLDCLLRGGEPEYNPFRFALVADALLFPDSARVVGVALSDDPTAVFLRIESPDFAPVPDGGPVPVVQVVYRERHHGPNRRLMFAGWTYDAPAPVRQETWRDRPSLL